MPLFESTCFTIGCSLRDVPVEHYYKNSTEPMQPCESCGCGTLKVEFSRFGIVFTGVITAKYNDREKDGAHRDGHWGFDKGPDGKTTTPCRIETWQDQKDYCKRNGLMNPKDMGRNYNVAKDGRTVESPMGLPGVEV